MTRKIFFCHIPKTGGTSLRRGLEVHFEKWQTIPDVFMMSRNRGRYPPIDISAYVLMRQPDAVALFRGHYHFSCHRLLGRDALRIVILRDPVQRFLSLLKHMLKNGRLTRQALDEKLGEGLVPFHDNQMTRFLGGRLDIPNRAAAGPQDLRAMRAQHAALMSAPISDAEARLVSAKEALDSCEFVGTTENLQRLVTRVSQALGFAIDHQHMNKSGEELALTSNQLDVIERHHRLDRELYRHATRIASK